MALSETGIDPRTLRAATEYMTVIEIAHALFEVTTQSGSAYTVDLKGPACECPDFSHREDVTECKHIRRVRMEVGQVDLESLDTQLASTADTLEQQAEDLVETASTLRRARDRLAEVSER